MMHGPIIIIIVSNLSNDRSKAIIIAVCSETLTKHINKLCGQNVEFVNVKLVVHIVNTGL